MTAIESNLNDIKNRLAELNKTKETLEKQRNKVHNDLETLVKERDSVEKKRAEADVERQHKKSEVEELERELALLSKWSKFLANIYDKLLNQQELYAKRAHLAARLLQSADENLLSMYQMILEEMDKYLVWDQQIEAIAQANKSKRRDELTKCLKKILAEPTLTVTRDKLGQTEAQLTGLNLNYSDCSNVLEKYVRAELDKLNLDINEQGELGVKKGYEESLTYEDFLANVSVSEELRELVDRHLKAKYLIRRSTESKKLEEEEAKKRLEKSEQIENENKQVYWLSIFFFFYNIFVIKF